MLFHCATYYAQPTDDLTTAYNQTRQSRKKIFIAYKIVSRLIERNECEKANFWLQELKDPIRDSIKINAAREDLLHCANAAFEFRCNNNVNGAVNNLRLITNLDPYDKELAIVVHFARSDLAELMEDHEKAYKELKEVFGLATDNRDTAAMIKAAFGLARNSALFDPLFDNKKYVDVCLKLAKNSQKPEHLTLAYRALGLYYAAPRKLNPEVFLKNRFKYIDSSNTALKISLGYLNENEYQARFVTYRILMSNNVYLKNFSEVEKYLALCESVLPHITKRSQSQYYKGKGFYLVNAKKYKEGIEAYKQSIALGNEVYGSLKTNAETYLLIASAYEELQDFKSAYYSQIERELLLDSLNNIKLRKKVESLDQGFRLLLTEKENALLKAENLNNDILIKEKNRFLIFLSVTILLTAAFIILMLRNYSKEKKHVKALDVLNKQLSRQHQEIFEINRLLQLKVLRTQMNPHFIYNCLNSINSLLMKGKQEDASGYILKLSKLLRMILDFSDKQNIDLEEEINFLELYLTMESLRFGNDFKYQVFAENALLEDDISVPSLIIQPFVENAIWHGLLHKEGNKNLTVRFYLSPAQDKLCCSIEDNGIGRKRAVTVEKKHHGDTRHESKGIRITQERLEMLKYQAKNISVRIIDKQEDNMDDHGTLVMLELPLNEN